MLKGSVTWYTSLLLRKAGDTQLNDLDPGVSSVHFCNLPIKCSQINSFGILRVAITYQI